MNVLETVFVAEFLRFRAISEGKLEAAKDKGFYISLAADKNYVLEASIDRNNTSRSGIH